MILYRHVGGIIMNVDKIVEKRNKKGEKKNSYKRLEVRYFDASTADIW